MVAAHGPGCQSGRVINTSLVKKSGAIFKIIPPHSFTKDSRSPAQSTQCFRKANEPINDLVVITQNFRGDASPQPHPRDSFATLLSGDGGELSQPELSHLHCLLSPCKTPGAIRLLGPGFGEQFSTEASEPGCGPATHQHVTLGGLLNLSVPQVLCL